MVISGDSLVLSHSVSCDLSLSWGEPPRIGVVVGHKICKNEGKYKTKRSEEEEEDLPCGYRRVVNFEQLVRDAQRRTERVSSLLEPRPYERIPPKKFPIYVL